MMIQAFEMLLLGALAAASWQSFATLQWRRELRSRCRQLQRRRCLGLRVRMQGVHYWRLDPSGPGQSPPLQSDCRLLQRSSIYRPGAPAQTGLSCGENPWCVSLASCAPLGLAHRSSLQRGRCLAATLQGSGALGTCSLIAVMLQCCMRLHSLCREGAQERAAVLS